MKRKFNKKAVAALTLAAFGATNVPVVTYASVQDYQVAVDQAVNSRAVTEYPGDVLDPVQIGDSSTYYTIKDGAITISGSGAIPDMAFNTQPWKNYKETITTVVIEDGITRVGARNFDRLGGITSITLPSTLESVGESAFLSHKATELTIPKSVVSLEKGCFSQGYYLEKLIFEEGSSLTSIGQSAFYTNHALTNVTLPASVEEIGLSAFAESKGLISVDLSKTSVKELSDVFKYCSSLNKVELPSTLKELKFATFIGTALTEIELPSATNAVGSNVFDKCTNLESIRFNTDQMASISSDNFNEVSPDLTVYGHSSNTNLKKVVDAKGIKWGDLCPSHTFVINIPATCTTDGEQTCSNCGAKEVIPAAGHGALINTSGMKKEYALGEELDLHKINIVTECKGTPSCSLDGTVIVAEPSMISGYNKDALGKQTVTITVNGTVATVDVNVTEAKKVIQSVDLIEDPSIKTTYAIGESVDLTGMNLLVTYTDSTQETIPVTADMIDAFGTTTEGSFVMTIHYNGFNVLMNYEVINKVESIERVNVPKEDSERFLYEELNPKGITLDVKTSKGPKVVSVDSSMITGYDKNVKGKQTLTINYGGLTAEYDVNVILPTNDESDVIQVKVGDDLKEYLKAYDFEYTLSSELRGDITFKGKYENFNFDGIDISTDQPRGFAIVYEVGPELKLSVQVNVVEEVKEIKDFTITGHKEEYMLNEDFDPSGTVTINYKDGTSETVKVSDMKLLRFTTHVAGRTDVTLYWGNNEFTYPIVVKEAPSTPVDIITTVSELTPTKNLNIRVEALGDFAYVELPSGQKVYSNDFKFNVKENGTYIFNVVGKDGKSAKSSIVEITNIDNEAPIITFGNFNPLVSSELLVKVIDEAPCNLITPDGKEYTAIDEVNYDTANGMGTFIATDLAGNVSTKDYMINQVNIGTGGKSHTFVAVEGISPEWTNKDIDLLAGAFNETDGVKSVSVVPTDEYVPPTTFNIEDEISTPSALRISPRADQSVVVTTCVVTENGSYTVEVVNDFGVYTEEVIVDKIDKTAPSISVVDNGDGTFTITADDNESGIKSLSVPGVDYVESNGARSNLSITVTNGLGEFDIVAYDVAGNEATDTVSVNNPDPDPEVKPIPPVDPGDGDGGSGGDDGSGDGDGDSGSGGGGDNGSGGSGSGGSGSGGSGGSGSGGGGAVIPDPTPNPSEPKVVIKDSIQIDKLYGYVDGYEDDTFRPDSSITRAELAAMLSKIVNGEAKSEVIFDDLTSHWAKEAVAEVYELGLMGGYPDGTFGPDKKLTREELCAVVYRFIDMQKSVEGETLVALNDIDNSFAKRQIASLVNLGLVSGYEDGSFKPSKSITRAETVSLLNRLLGDLLVQDNTPNFKDINSHWASKEIIKAYK